MVTMVVTREKDKLGQRYLFFQITRVESQF